MGSLIDDHMLPVYFLYGLAFSAGIAVLLQPRWGKHF